jgi:hypothetical protein
VIVSAGGRFLVCASAAVIEPDDQLKAWVERHVRQDPDIRWIVGNYVEANEPNRNGHTFPVEELLTSQETLAGKPLNIGHREHYIVGSFAGAQLLHSTGDEYVATDPGVAASQDVSPPYVEALAGMWHRRFPEEFFNIRQAHSEGTLFFSMEAIPEEVSCPTCAWRAPYAGLESDTYCGHMQGSVGPKVLHKPTFNGGAIIIPPLKPGWSRADITAISKLITESVDEAEQVHDAVAAAAPHADPRQWEAAMTQILVMAREVPRDTRKKMAKKGTAMPDGSYPIANASDLRNAIQAIGRAKDPAAAKAHIKRRAKALGLGDLIPDGW